MAITFGPKLGLMVNGVQGEVHYDELMALLRGIDALIQCRVSAHTSGTPPGVNLDGQTHIVGASATGAWAGRENAIARWSTVLTDWEFYTPAEGWIAWSEETDEHLRFADADGWQPLGTAYPGGGVG